MEKPPETRKGGKGGGKGKRGKSETRVEKRKMQCIHFFMGTCQKGDHCRYEHQIVDDGQPMTVGPEILQRFDEAVKRYNESRVQATAKPKAAPRGGVSSSMIILEPNEVKHGVVISAMQALDNDLYYSMLDSGTNAIIIPLQPGMNGEIAECQVPSATVTGPIVQVYEFEGAKRLVVALPNSAILVSQEWLTTIAGWTFVSGPMPGISDSSCENRVCVPGADHAYMLNMKNGLPYLSKELFWKAMEDVSNRAKLASGHEWQELKTMIDNRRHEPQPQIYAVKSVTVTETPTVMLSPTHHTHHFNPCNVRGHTMDWFERFRPSPNPNRGRLTGTAPSLTFGAQTGRGSDRSCVIKRTMDYDYLPLITLVHELAQGAAAPMLPYLGFQILRLGEGQSLNQHRDYHNHSDYPNHTMKFGQYTGGSLQMWRDGKWHSYDTENQWVSFDALKVVHKVTPVTLGARYSVTLCTPGKLDRLTAQDWDHLAKAGFPIYLYEPLPARMRRLTTPSHVMSLKPAFAQIQETLKNGRAESSKTKHHDVLSSHLRQQEEELWDDIPLPSVGDPNDASLLKPKTLLECCRDAQEFMDEYDLNDGHDHDRLYLMRIWGHRTRMLSLFQALQSAVERNDRQWYLWTLTNVLRLVFHMANEAGLETVLSAAYSLKHETDMKKSFPSQEEAFDKAKQMGLTPEQAARQVTATPKGQFALYDEKRGEVVKSDRWRPPDFRSLIRAAQTEQGKSEVSCVLDDTREVIMARPMIFSEETQPTHFTFANQVGVQTDLEHLGTPVPDELSRTIESHLWLANLETSSGCTPTMSSTSKLPRQPHPDGPSIITWHQLEHEQNALVQAHDDNDVSRMLRGVVSNMHLLSREAGFLPYIGHAHYLYECYLKSKINSSRPPADLDLSSVWSLQVDLNKDLPKACSLSLKPSL